jgi:hypothetical protein
VDVERATTVTLVEARVTVGPQPRDPDGALEWLHDAVRVVEVGVGEYQVSRRRWYLTREFTWERKPAAQADWYDDFQTRTKFRSREALSLARRVAVGEFDRSLYIRPGAEQ